VARQFKAVIADFITDDLALERRVLDGLAEVQACNVSREEELFGRVEDADALMLYQYVYLSGKTISRLTRCKVIVCCGVGYDNVDLNSAREMGIPVANIPDYGSEEVADSAIGLTLALTRGIASLNARLRGGLGPWDHTQGAPLHRLRGRVFGVVGLGRIGLGLGRRPQPPAFGWFLGVTTNLMSRFAWRPLISLPPSFGFSNLKGAGQRSRKDTHSSLAEGDKVMVRWTALGTHKGQLLNLAATDTQITVSGIDVYRFSGGKIHETWTSWDALGFLQQLGAVSELGQPRTIKSEYR
jgi:hypothetical protein